MLKKVLVVDDDTIVRITLHSLVDWNALGYQITADAIHGEQALSRLREQPFDLVITDMKMPVMDGLGLLEQMNRMVQNGQLPYLPKVLVLSGYDDFKLVREAFRLGARDYLLKADFNGETLKTILSRFMSEWSQSERTQGAQSQKEPAESKGRILADMAMGKRELSEEFFLQNFRTYVVIQFEIEEFLKHSGRFGGDLEESMVKPVLEFAKQIPRVASKCVLGSISPSRYVMLMSLTEPQNIWQDTVVSTCRQLCRVWNNYMNLPVSCGISGAGTAFEEFPKRFEEAGNQLMLFCLKGNTGICYPWERGVIQYEEAVQTGRQYEKLLNGLLAGDELTVEQEKKRFFAACYTGGLEQAKAWCLHLICQLAWRFRENHEDINALFADEVDYYKKLERLDEIRNLELWMNNYIRWVADYLQHHNDWKQNDLMSRAKRFILDNYANPELTLGSVAGYVGLNEKYFSSRFTKEEGMTFSNYLTEVRIRKARELMEQTDLKIYEISQNVGYNSVEHFTRVFKKLCNVSPGNYRK